MKSINKTELYWCHNGDIDLKKKSKKKKESCKTNLKPQNVNIFAVQKIKNTKTNLIQENEKLLFSAISL